MLKNISGLNYKAFDNFDISIAPITVLLGSNSSGKSSIINLLLMLSQTFDSTKELDSPLRLNGRKVDLGEAINIQHHRDQDIPLHLNFSVDNRDYNRHARMIIERTISSILELIVYSQPRSLLTKTYQIDEDGELYHYLMTSSRRGLRRKNTETFRNHSDTIQNILTKLSDSSISSNVSLSQEETSAIETYKEFIEYIINVDQNRLTAYSVEYILSNEIVSEQIEEIKHKVSHVILKNKLSEVIFRIDFKNKSIHSDIINNDYLAKDSLGIFRSLSPDSLTLRKKARTAGGVASRHLKFKVKNFVLSIIKDFTDKAAVTFNDESILHVTPLRAQPKRYYLLENSLDHQQLNTFDSSSLAEILKKNPDIVESLNDILCEFDMSIILNKTNEIIHQIRIVQNNLELDITDVGFGVSQVLPILVQALKAEKYSVVIIEQPEIHLHPKMQTWLTDFLVNISLDKKIRFIIETHSESIIKRLQLRMLDPKYDFDHTSVSILNFERHGCKNHTNTNISKVEINEYCEITWPKGFYDDKLNDALMIQEHRIALMKRNEQLNIGKNNSLGRESE